MEWRFWRRDFLIDDLRAITAEAGVTGTIVVEAERAIEETAWLSQVAASIDLICGVVGWAPLTSPTVYIRGDWGHVGDWGRNVPHREGRVP
jgi:predicted TIM-barrel fold metal-dependent hydrolase